MNLAELLQIIGTKEVIIAQLQSANAQQAQVIEVLRAELAKNSTTSEKSHEGHGAPQTE